MEFLNNNIKLEFNEVGQLISFYQNQKNYLYEKTFLIKIFCDEKYFEPKFLTIKNKNILVFDFEKNLQVEIKIKSEENYFSFEVLKISEEIDILVWGQIPLIMSEKIGGVLGCCSDNNFTIGIQCLNYKTMGGIPSNFQNNYFYELSEKKEYYIETSVATLNIRELAAAKTNFGGILQAYSKKIYELEYEKNIICIENIIGSKIALYGCKNSEILNMIKEIEIKENLPHPKLKKEWVKISTESTVPYLISEFSEDNIEQIILKMQKTGFEYLYHPEPFSTWGNFNLRKEFFPNGLDGLKKCSEIAAKYNVKLGIHTLSNFITTNDSLITPIPNKNLAFTGESFLLNDIPEEKEYADIDLNYVENFLENSALNTIKINDELIQFEKISFDKEKLAILKCVRGAFGTKISSHKKGAKVFRLKDHPYKVFFPNKILLEKICNKLIYIINYCNLKQISFDGLEGTYTENFDAIMANKFVEKIFRETSEDLINDASRLNHFTWHIHTRTNWGEPWGEETRNGMTEFRAKNQIFYEENLFPRMLGWYIIRGKNRKLKATSKQDIEWIMAKSVGYNAGYSICIKPKVLFENGNIDEIFEKISLWNQINKSKIDLNLKKALCNPSKEWQVYKKEKNEEISIRKVEFLNSLCCLGDELQPGQIGGADWCIENKFFEQSLKFVLNVDGYGKVSNINFRIDGEILSYKNILNSGDYLIFDENCEFKQFDSNWNLKNKLKIDNWVYLRCGLNNLSVSCDFLESNETEINVQIYLFKTE